MPSKNKSLDDSQEKLAEEVEGFFKPKEDELKRELTEEEQILICLNFKCQVRMDYWNPLNEFNEYFKRKGKFANKTEDQQRKLLLKAAKRYKDDHRFTFTQKEIDESRRKLWEYRKSRFVRWLDSNDGKINEKEIRSSVSSDNGSNETVIYSGSLITLPCTQEEQDENANHVERDKRTNIALEVLPNNLAENILQTDSIEDLNRELSADLPTECIDTEDMTQSENIPLVFQNSEGYNHFNLQIGVTSTQSQSQSQES